MASTLASSDTTHGRSSLRGRWSIAVPVAFVLAFVSVQVLALRDTARFSTEAELSHLTFGAPLGWLKQDQSAFDPPFPGTSEFRSPWEHPFSVEFVPLLFNVAIVMIVLLAAWTCIRALRSR